MGRHRGLLAKTFGQIVLLVASFAAVAADELETISLPPRPRCVNGEPKHFEESCAYLDRRDAIAAADAHAPQDALYGIYEFHTGTNSAELALDRDGWAGYSEASDIGVSLPGVVGRYRERDGVLIVDLERRAGYANAPARLEYRVVRWGRHVFLFSPDAIGRIVAFLDRDGLEQATFMLAYEMQRLRNRNDPLCGSPDLPREWRSYLHARPISVTLIDARLNPSPQLNPAAYAREYLIEIDAGRAQGLFPKMYLVGEAADSKRVNIYSVIDRVDERRAWGTLVVEPQSTTSSADELVVGKGTRLTTGTGWDPKACVPMR